MLARFLGIAMFAVLALGARDGHAYPGLGGFLSHSRDDISGFTPLAGDSAVANATIPFAVKIGGTNYTTVAISTNGWMEFGGNTAADSDPTNDCLPSAAHTNPLLAYYWDDMRTINTAIRYGTVGTAPGRTFIVDADIENVAGSNHDVTLQVQIHEGSNLVTVKYDDSESESIGQTATIGFQGAGGSGATARGITCNGRVLDDNGLLDGWGIDLGLPSGTALSGFMESSRDDISGFTTLSGNDNVATPPLPFPVLIDGTSYSTLAISTNGWMEFGGNTSGNSDPTNDCLPSAAHTNPLLAAYWDDMVTINTHIRYGTVGASPNRTFVIDVDAENATADNNDITYQVQIKESGLVTVKYVPNQPLANGQTATIGFQGAGGAAAIPRSYTCNAKVLDDNLADEGWSIDLGSPRSSSINGFTSSSRDDLTGLATLSGNDSVATAILPFTLTLEGVGYTTVALSTNGWLEFGGNTAGNSDPANVCLPATNHTNPFLAAYWDDMRTVGLAVRYGTQGSAGGRVFIADFEIENNNAGAHNLTMQVQVHERSNLITVKYLDTEDQANGQTATVGYQTAGGAAATVRSLTCNGKVLDDNSVRGEGWSVAQVDICGDGIVSNEQCDLAAQNGAASSCCTAACAFRANGQTCRAGGGVCDVAETCTGSSATCPANGFEPTSVVCRGSAGDCDPAESCPGNAAACPGDTKSPSGTACTSDGNPCSLDQCNGSSDLCQHPAGNAGAVCRASAGDCDVMETCTGASTTCPGDGFASSGSLCRASAGECDLAELCNGGGPACPGDAKVPGGTACTSDGDVCTVDECNGASNACQHPAGNGGTICRASAGDCDVAETCTGTSPGCPADGFESNATVCRASTGVCDVAETCTGSSANCPPDVFEPASTVCRGAAGDCDVAETCTGSGAACPGDALEPSSTVCRATAGDCDVAESCTGSSAACPADVLVSSGTECRASGGICDVAESCDGANAACPADGFEPSTTQCRAAAGVCDVTETCTGSSAACPPDAVEPSSTVCRGAAGVCDVAETCTGSGVDCPADALEPSSTVCRAAAGDCDVAEACTGSGPSCPSNALAASGTECRAAAGPCDVAEACDGASTACPANAFEPSTTECRAAGGACDVAETCTGSGAACPADSVSGAFVVCRASGGACDPAESCDGVGVGCPVDAKEPASTVCRSTAGVCDAAESCDGVGDVCPPDGKQPTSVVCQPAGGTCDVAETCDGIGNACPADGKAPSGTVCRSAAGGCDLAEVCNGASDLCPGDVKQPAGTECRAVAGLCDVAETCDGSGDTCPADAVASSGTVCRASTSSCDLPESCNGSATSCPADTGQPDGDGDGTCDAEDGCPTTADPGQADGDGDGLGDVCDPCTNVYNGGAFATKAKIIVTKLLTAPGDDKVKMKGYLVIPTTPTIEPDNRGMRILLQKQDGSVVIDTTLPVGAYSTVAKAGWKVNGTRTKFTYKNSGAPTPLIDGINKASIGMSTKTPGLAKFSVGGKNSTYAPIVLGDLPLKGTIVVDVPFATAGQCGETNFATGNCIVVSAGNTVKCQLK